MGYKKQSFLGHTFLIESVFTLQHLYLLYSSFALSFISSFFSILPFSIHFWLTFNFSSVSFFHTQSLFHSLSHNFLIFLFDLFIEFSCLFARLSLFLFLSSFILAFFLFFLLVCHSQALHLFLFIHSGFYPFSVCLHLSARLTLISVSRFLFSFSPPLCRFVLSFLQSVSVFCLIWISLSLSLSLNLSSPSFHVSLPAFSLSFEWRSSLQGWVRWRLTALLQSIQSRFIDPTWL